MTVVTTTAPDGTPHGLTVNSLVSLSLEPPQLIVCLKRANRSYAAFADATHFAVNVLAEDQLPLSRFFASDRERKFDDVPHHAGAASGAPLLAGAHAWLECAVADRLAVVGTHVIVIGSLLAFGLSDAPPLLFHRGTYHRLGDVLSR